MPSDELMGKTPFCRSCSFISGGYLWTLRICQRFSNVAQFLKAESEVHIPTQRPFQINNFGSIPETLCHDQLDAVLQSDSCIMRLCPPPWGGSNWTRVLPICCRWMRWMRRACQPSHPLTPFSRGCTPGPPRATGAKATHLVGPEASLQPPLLGLLGTAGRTPCPNPPLPPFPKQTLLLACGPLRTLN